MSDMDMPAEGLAVLASNPGAKEAYGTLAPSHQREYAKWVSEAKQVATRERRAAKMVEMLLAEAKRN